MNEERIWRGDVFFVDYKSNTIGSEIESGRPAVVVSNNLANKHSGVVSVVWLTTAEKKPLPTHCPIMCREPSTALCEQVTSIAKERLGDYVRSCTEKEMAALDECLRVALALETESDEQLLNDRMSLGMQVADLKTKNRQLEKEVEELKGQNLDALTAELKTYKTLYEKLMDRLIG